MVPPSPPSGWDFHNEIKNQCRLLHGTPVHSSSFYCSRPFKLVVDVSRSTFRLEESSVALALRACLGGSPAGFLVKHLNDRCYTFCVCNKSVGLWIYNLRSYICHDYHMRFFLWRDGGPNWGFEFRRWESEQLNEWTVVKKKKCKSSVVASSSVPISRVFNRLHVLDPPCPSPVAAGEKVSVSAPDPISHKPVSRPKVPVADGNAPNAISKSFFNFNSGPKAARVLGLSSKSSVLSNGLPIRFGKSRLKNQLSSLSLSVFHSQLLRRNPLLGRVLYLPWRIFTLIHSVSSLLVCICIWPGLIIAGVLIR